MLFRSIPQIEVSFDIDANGIVHVSAKDLGTGNSQNITITASTKLSDSDIEKAVKEAEQFASEDKQRKDEVETKNQAASLIYQTEKTMKDLGDKIDQADQDKINAEVEKLKQVADGTDYEAMKTAIEGLTTVSYEVFGKVYQAAQAEQQAQGQPQDAPQDSPDVVDADYTVNDDDKNA